MTRPLARDHLDSPEEINWSITTCAPFEKSPNCASQRTRVSGSEREYPNSKPRTPSSDNKLSITSKLFCFFDILCNKCDISFMNLEFVLIPTILISITSISGESIERNYAITDRFMDGPLDGWSKYVGTCYIEELGCALFSELSERPCGRFKGSIEDYLAKYNKSDMERLNLTIILPSSLDVPDC